MAIREPRVFFLQPAGVGQHQRAQVRRSRGAEDLAVEAAGDETRQQARVIDVRVRQDDRSQRRRMNRERSPVAAPQLLQALKLTAIDQQPIAIDVRAGIWIR